MKKTLLKYLAFLIAIVVIYIIGVASESLFNYFIVPYTFIGDILRKLSLASDFGNSLSIVMYILFSLIPIFLGIKLHIKKKLTILGGVFLVVLSVMQFITIYYSINQHILLNLMNPIFLNSIVDVNMLSITILSGLVYIDYLLILIGILFVVIKSKPINVYSIFSLMIDIIILILMTIFIFKDFNYFINILEAENTDFYILSLEVIKVLSSLSIVILTILLMIKFIRITKEMNNQVLDSNLMKTAKDAYMISFILILVTIITQILINGWQLVFLAHLNNVAFTLNLPIFSIAFALVGLLFYKYLGRVNELQEDHSMII